MTKLVRKIVIYLRVKKTISKTILRSRFSYKAYSSLNQYDDYKML